MEMVVVDAWSMWYDRKHAEFRRSQYWLPYKYLDEILHSEAPVGLGHLEIQSIKLHCPK
jgi:hypothetical protein